MRLTLPIQSYNRGGHAERLVNCYAEQNPVTAKTLVDVRKAPGIRQVRTVGAGPIRGAVYWDGHIYVVSGSRVFRVSQSDAIDIGGLPGTGPVQMAANRMGVVMVSGDGYYTTGTNVTQITDVDYLGASDVAFLDNFLLFLKPETDTIYSGELGSLTDFNGLAFAVAESSPDKAVGIIADHGQLIVAGESSTEIWWNEGTTPFAFGRIPNGVLEVGCSAGRSLAKIDNSVFWLDDRRIVRRLDGLTPVRVSQHGVEEALQSYADVSGALGFAYTIEGHLCYVLTLDQATWVYDITTQEWHERKSLGRTNWAVSRLVEAWGRTWVFDGNRMGELRADEYAEWGQELVPSWTYPPVYAERRLVSHRRLEIAAQMGAGGQISLEYSPDGKTWVPLPAKSLGAVGEYSNRAVWHNLGSARQRFYRASVSEAVPVVISDTVLEASGGRF